MENISIYSNTKNGELSENEQHGLPGIKRTTQFVSELSVEMLSRNLNTQISAIRSALKESSKSSGFQVEKVKVKLVVDAKGGVHLFGELSAGISASIEVELKP